MNKRVKERLLLLKSKEYQNLRNDDYNMGLTIDDIENSEIKINALRFIKNVENENLISIALECGFNNVRSFNKAFKEYYLKTPSEYKKNNSLFS